MGSARLYVPGASLENQNEFHRQEDLGQEYWSPFHSLTWKTFTTCPAETSR